MSTKVLRKDENGKIQKKQNTNMHLVAYFP